MRNWLTFQTIPERQVQKVVVCAGGHEVPFRMASSLCKGQFVQPRGLLEGQPQEFFPLLHTRVFSQNLKCYWSTVVGAADKPAQILPVNKPIAGNDMVNIFPDPV